MEKFIFVLFISFVLELCVAGYTLALTRGNVGMAIVCTVLSSVIPYIAIVSVFENINNLYAIAAGNAVGTFAVLRVVRK